MNGSPGGVGSQDEPAKPAAWPPPPPAGDSPTVPIPAVDPTNRYAVHESAEARLERAWLVVRHWIAVAALAGGVAIVPLLLVASLAAPFDDRRPFVGGVLHAAGRLVLVGLVYAAFLVPVARVAITAGRSAPGEVRQYLADPRAWRRLVTVGVTAPIVAFAVLEPTAALIVVAVLLLVFLALNLLGLGF